jgi:hypothetical protein
MDEFIEKIHKEYLKEEIKKMEKTAKGLERMIEDIKFKKDNDLIKNFKDMHCTTKTKINQKKKELKKLSKKNFDLNNN